MSGRRWEDLPRPRAGFRPSEDTRRADGKISFETLEDCRSEDRLCTKALRRWSRKLDPGLREAAQDLEHRLLLAANRPAMAAETLASKVYARNIRERIVGNLWPMVEDLATGPVAFVTLLPVNMWVPAAQLLSVNPRRLIKRLRNHLDRAGVTAAGGWLYGTLDAEFDSRRGGYDFHFHLIVAGDKTAALEGLRALGRYAPVRCGAHEVGRRGIDRIQVQTDIDNLPDPLTYAAKLRVFDVPSFIGEDGTVETGTYVRRVPQPHLSHWLLWMDQWRVSDLLITQGLVLTAAGIRCKHPFDREYV